MSALTTTVLAASGLSVAPEATASVSEVDAALEQSRRSGEPVVLPSRTTATSVTAVTPDGRFVTDITAAPVRVRAADGTWRDVDTRLVESGGALRPKAAGPDVRFSTGGSGPFAEIGFHPGTSVALRWPGALPRPVVEGDKAVYRDVAGAGGDLVVTALPAGMRFDLVLRERPAAPVEVRVPVTAVGADVRTSGGRLQVVDGDQVIVASSKAAMWDAGSPMHPDKTGDITSEVQDTADGKTLVLRPAMSFLTSPATVYPVTVDPSIVLPLTGDTDVNSVFDGNNVSGEYLKAGTEADGEKARVYLKFDTRGLTTPTKAELKLTNVDAPRCGTAVGAGLEARRITDFWSPETQTWTPQPSSTGEDAALSTEGSQLGSCGSGRMTWDLTRMVTNWAAGAAKNHGIVIQSPAETATANYRVFTSSENTEEFGTPPTLTVTTDIPFIPGEGDDPADPGPSPADQWPGRVEPETGAWVTSGTDVTEAGLLVTRSHSAGRRVDVTRPNENVLGPHWRMEPLGGMLGDRLKDFSANGYVQINLSSGTESNRYLADPARPGTFTAEDGSTVVKNADGTFTEQGTADTGLVRTWTGVGAEYLITGVTTAEGGTTTITYDAQGRVSGMASADDPAVTCTGSPACDSTVLRYATTTTATGTQFGDVAGQLKEIVHDAAGDAAPITIVSYAYDSTKRLRQVNDLRRIDGEPVATSSYTYDAAGNITQLSTPAEGAWTLTYAAPGKLSSATKAPTAELQAHCKYASQYLWGRNGCWAGPVPMEYGGRGLQPRWKRTPGNKAVVGVNNDNCTSPTGSRPKGFNFAVACDMHDYGYGIIYLKTRTWDKSKKHAVDSVFYTTLRDYTCNAYPAIKRYPGTVWSYRQLCRNWAYAYYTAVRVSGGLSMKYWRDY
ncbi:phospholipase A2 [Saccharothrix syringae]|uniref:DNRLRE domain-containing protein n=1 Tax=Saccharothrix syringae TaxID=103733 RepID=A0A5Q0H9F0_SACSY|nr:phospholipase A2 [Saccharothrix syringae]QFZ22450.1 DNRLRE domain-containing protein [Saccharothrix syringae]